MLNVLGILLPLIIVIISSLIMWKSCTIFNKGSRIVGAGLPDGVRGATINAIGSSLPEFITALLFFVILTDSVDGMSAALGTVIGSAIFNILIIPSIVIAILIKKNHNLNIKKTIILRDGLILLIIQFFLLQTLQDHTITLTESITLLVFYIIYIIILFTQTKLKQVQTNTSKQELKQGWKHIIIGAIIASLGCWLCVHACEALSQSEWKMPFYEITKIKLSGLNISIGITALFIAAAASSLPDLFLSVIDAKQGHVDDALSNPLGSNIFDLCIAFSVPLMLYTLLNGEIQFNNLENINELKHFILLMITITTLFLLSMAFWQVKKFHWGHVIFFIILFFMFILFILNPHLLEKINYFNL